MKKHRKLWICTVAVLALNAILIGACAIYLCDYYPADSAAIAAFRVDNPVEQTVLEDGSIVYEPNAPLAGFIFYPGGKVEHTAYLPLMQALASNGILTVLVEMPFRLAVLDVSAADGIRDLYPNIDVWFIGGHSLGGSMAASYLSEHVTDFNGLILLGSYSTADLSSTDLAVLSIYGSEDRVLNMEKYKENKSNLPPDFTETVIDGGCHAYFGMYGAQDGDGTPTLSPSDQIETTATEIFTFITKQAVKP